MITLILAAGTQERWRRDGDAPPWPKQLAPIDGQPLLERTMKQLGEYETKVILVTHSDELAKYGGRVFDPSPANRWTAETLRSTQHLWGARTTILLGDVVYSPWALDRIMTSPERLAFFGRQDLRHRPLGQYYEMFGLSFSFHAAPTMLQAATKAINGAGNTETTAKLRTIYNIIAELPLKEYHHECELFFPIDDWTEDLDTPDDYLQFVDVAVKRGWCHARN
jgi:hypothetical protein